MLFAAQAETATLLASPRAQKRRVPQLHLKYEQRDINAASGSNQQARTHRIAPAPLYHNATR